MAVATKEYHTSSSNVPQVDAGWPVEAVAPASVPEEVTPQSKSAFTVSAIGDVHSSFAGGTTIVLVPTGLAVPGITGLPFIIADIADASNKFPPVAVKGTS